MSQIGELIIYILVFAFSVSFHEASHAVVAYFLGDPTGKHHGRISLNPMRHIDIVGLLFLIFARFGWAKPVPITPSNFEHPKLHVALSAAAGPVSNLILAAISLNLMQIIPNSIPIVSFFLLILYKLNLFLAAFNLIPIFPLDGEKILRLFISRKFEDSYEVFASHGPLVLFGLMGIQFIMGIAVLGTILTPIVNFLATGLEFLVFYT